MRWIPDWLTGYDAENAQRAAEADARLRTLNAQRAQELGSEWEAHVNRNYSTQEQFGEAAQRQQIADAFDEGWEEGRGNVSGFIKGTLNKIIADPLRAVIGGIPWWLWLVAIGFVLWKFGLLNGLFRKIKSATA